MHKSLSRSSLGPQTAHRILPSALWSPREELGSRREPGFFSNLCPSPSGLWELWKTRAAGTGGRFPRPVGRWRAEARGRQLSAGRQLPQPWSGHQPPSERFSAHRFCRRPLFSASSSRGRQLESNLLRANDFSTAANLHVVCSLRTFNANRPFHFAFTRKGSGRSSTLTLREEDLR